MGRCVNYYDYYIIKMILMILGVELYVNGFLSRIVCVAQWVQLFIKNIIMKLSSTLLLFYFCYFLCCCCHHCEVFNKSVRGELTLWFLELAPSWVRHDISVHVIRQQCEQYCGLWNSPALWIRPKDITVMVDWALRSHFHSIPVLWHLGFVGKNETAWKNKEGENYE